MPLSIFTAHQLTKFAMHVAKTFVQSDLIGYESTISRDMRDAYQAKIAIIDSRAAGEAAPGSDRTGGAGAEDKSVTLTQYDGIEANDLIPYEQGLQLPWNLVMETTDKLGEDVAAAKMLRFVNYLAGVVSVAAPDHRIVGKFLESDAGIALEVRNAIIKAATRFANAHLPAGPQHNCIIWNPATFNSCFTEESVVRGDWGGGRRTEDLGMGQFVYGGFTHIRGATGFGVDSSAMTTPNGGTIPAKYKKNLAPGGEGGVGAVVGVGWNKRALAQGFVGRGKIGDPVLSNTPRITVHQPEWIGHKRSWLCGATLHWDVQYIHQGDAGKGLGVIRFADDGV